MRALLRWLVPVVYIGCRMTGRARFAPLSVFFFKQDADDWLARQRERNVDEDYRVIARRTR